MPLFDPWRPPFASKALAACILLSTLPPAKVARADFTYTDGSFGLSIRLPDNTTVSRVKNPAGNAGTEIGQFTLPNGNVIGRLVVSDLPEDVPFQKAADQLREQLAKDSGVALDKVSSEKTRTQGNAKAALLLEAWDGEHTMFNGVLAVQGPSDQMLIMYVATHEMAREKAAERFRNLAGGFTVLLRADDDTRAQAAKTRGMQILMDLLTPAPTAEDLWDRQYFLLSSGDEPCGYLAVSESLEERGRRPGLALAMERWVFWPRGDGAEYESQKAYASWDLHDDEWSSRMETAVEVPGQPVKMMIGSQSVLRLGTSLMIETIDPHDGGKPAKRVIPYPRTVLPQAWGWLLPRLLARQSDPNRAAAGQWIALVTYSPARRGLETQMFSRASHGSIRQVLQREGPYGSTQSWQFASGGALKQITTTDMKLSPTSEAEVKRLFGPRIAQWKSKAAGTKNSPERTHG